MEKKFAVISIIIMCAVFAFIFIQNAGGKPTMTLLFLPV